MARNKACNQHQNPTLEFYNHLYDFDDHCTPIFSITTISGINNV